ncbi:MAG: hypothetical protein PHU73_02515 [Patescibacteria group bacterium]|nr:hypothetical protein [Patescibacteria group bacterium]
MSPNGFGISEVAGVPTLRDERQFRVFRVPRCRERERATERDEEGFRSRSAEKERA